MDTDVVASTRATYDRVAVDYDRRNGHGDPVANAFRTEFGQAVLGPVADLGCGPGRDLQALRDDGLQALGVDLSPGMLTLARRRGVPVVQGDLRDPPLRPGSLGGVWSSAALLHVPRADVPGTLASWRDLLRPGGRLGLATALGEDEGWEVVPYAKEGPSGGELHRWFVYHQEADLLDLLVEAGFTVLSAQTRQSNRTWLMVHAHA